MDHHWLLGKWKSNENGIAPQTSEVFYDTLDWKQPKLAGMWWKWNTHSLFVGMLSGLAVIENSMNILKILKIKLLYVPKIILLGKIANLKRHMHTSSHCSVIYNSQDLEITQIDKGNKRTNQLCYVYTMG